MKKVIAILLVAIMSVSLVACGNKNNGGNAGNEQGSSNGQSTTQQNNGNNSGDTSKQQTSDRFVIHDGSKLGVLQPVAEQTDFVIKGLYISSESGQHEYESVENISALGIDGLNSEFELNEWMGFYVDTESTAPMNIYIVRNDAEADYTKVTVQELEGICSDKDYPVLANVTPDTENYGSVGQAYVNPESSQPDLFNVFFTANGKVCYMVQLNLIAENSVE